MVTGIGGRSKKLTPVSLFLPSAMWLSLFCLAKAAPTFEYIQFMARETEAQSGQVTVEVT